MYDAVRFRFENDIYKWMNYDCFVGKTYKEIGSGLMKPELPLFDDGFLRFWKHDLLGKVDVTGEFWFDGWKAYRKKS